MHKFKDLHVYKKALQYSKFVRQSTKKFPKDELFGLTSQFRRAADSIVLNIAGGAREIQARRSSRNSLTSRFVLASSVWRVVTYPWKTSSLTSRLIQSSPRERTNSSRCSTGSKSHSSARSDRFGAQRPINCVITQLLRYSTTHILNTDLLGQYYAYQDNSRQLENEQRLPSDGRIDRWIEEIH